MQFEHDFFKGTHQFEQRHGLYFRAFPGFFADLCNLFLQVATLHHQHAQSFHFGHFRGRFFEAFVFKDLIDEFLAGIDLVALRIQFFSWQQHFCLDAHECAYEQNEFAAEFDIKFVCIVNEIQKIIRDPGNGNIVYIQFITFDEEKQQVKWSFKLVEFDLIGSSVQRNSVNSQKYPPWRDVYKANLLILGRYWEGRPEMWTIPNQLTKG